MEKNRQYVYAQIQEVSSDPDSVLDKLTWYIDELLKWNRSVNLTSITNPAECWEKHIQDSLLSLPYVYSAGEMLDIGSGAGFPAIPIKLCCPEMYVTAVDKVRKKINFQNHCKRQLHLNRFDALSVNIGNIHKIESTYDVVIARALAPLEKLVQLGGGYIKPGGMLIALKSRIDDTELRTGIQSALTYGMELEQVVHTALKPSMAERKLIVLRKA